MAPAVMKEPLIDYCEDYMVNSDDCKIIEFDLTKIKKEDLEYSVAYELTMKRNDKVHALLAWFDCKFSDLKNPITLSTSPYNEYTHWKQTVFYLD
jgi:protein arginine N-methyltransferase 1